jgi:serpin B
LFLANAGVDEQRLVQGNSAFAIDLYHKLSESEDNIFFSPYSISTTLAMTYAGARGNTEKEMVETLRFSLDQENIHPAFAGIESKLKELQKSGNIQLSVANALWPQKDYAFYDEYLSLIKKHYGVSITPVDYKHAGEAAREMINKWVEDKTQDKIQGLIQPGTFNALTRLVLVDAIYFKGDWESPFEPHFTMDAPFYITPNKTVLTPLMAQENYFRYAECEDIQILELPYVGYQLSMIILLPKKTNRLKQVESSLTVENLWLWESRLEMTQVTVFIPKFKMTSMFRLDKTLMSMGMVDAFTESKADYSGMDGKSNWLYIGAMLHKAFVNVNEEGTEAAAATGIGAYGPPPPTPIFRADHPFIFLIQDKRTGTILFIGRVTDPTNPGE